MAGVATRSYCNNWHSIGKVESYLKHKKFDYSKTSEVAIKRGEALEPSSDVGYEIIVDDNDTNLHKIEERYTPYDPRWYFPEGETPKKRSEMGSETTGVPSEPELYEVYETSVDEVERRRKDHSFDAIQYLFPCREKDYLICRDEDGNEEKVYADDLKRIRYLFIVSFYIPVMKYDEVAVACCNLLGIFCELIGEGKLADFEFVLVPRMRPDFPSYDNQNVAEDAFTHFFSAFSPLFLSVPIWDSARTLNLIRVMGSPCYAMPGCIVADLEKGQITHEDIVDICSGGPDLYPFTPWSERHLEVSKQADTIRSGRMPLATLLDRQSSDVLGCIRHSESSCGKQESLSSLSNKVVWLYYFQEGNFLDKLCHLYKLCKAKGFEFELVIVFANVFRDDKPTMSSSYWQDHVYSLLQNRDCCGWLLLPFTHRVSCRLGKLCTSCDDQLVIVGPNNDYFDPDGKDVYLDYGIGAYPFTKQTVWDNEVARLRSLSLQDWLRCGGIQTLKRGSEILPVSYLQGKDVLVYFGAFSSTGKLRYDDKGHLFKWISDMKSSAKVGVEVIFVRLDHECTDEDDCTDDGEFTDEVDDCTDEDECSEEDKSSPSVNDFCSELGWLLPIPHDTKCSDKVFRGVWFVAFGSNGSLLRIGLEESLEGNSEPATFPESSDGLTRDVGLMLTSTIGRNDVWCYAFRDQLYGNNI